MEPINTRLFDEILNGMPIDGRNTSTSYDSEEEKEQWTKALYVLKAYGYVDIIATEYSGIYAQSLTDAGVIFVSQGGFAEEERIRLITESDSVLQRENWITTTRTAKQAFWVSVLSFLAGAVAIVISIYALK